jgi:hypothetical protein
MRYDDRMKFVDLTGEKIGRLKVVRRVQTKRVNGVAPTKWECLCDCGNTCIVRAISLRIAQGAIQGTSAGTSSCGCLRVELGKKLGLTSRTHGQCRPGKETAEYRTWSSMISRCSNPNDLCWPDYGMRGIIVCERWKTFENFFADMGKRPKGTSEGGRSLYSLDRIDNDGNYEPGNCRWATSKEQNRNRRANVMLVLNGRTRTLAEWSDLLGVSRKKLRAIFLQDQHDESS